MSDQSLQRGFMTATARAACERYQMLLGAVLTIEGAAGVAMLIAPESVSRLLHYGEGGWTRVAGLLLIIVTALLATGRGAPAYAKRVNLIGVTARTAIGLLLVALCGRMMWIGVIMIVASGVLGWSYFRYFKAEVMNRP